jgi:hypothetical protein
MPSVSQPKKPPDPPPLLPAIPLPFPSQDITWQGKQQSLRQWALELGFSYSTLKRRVALGWPVDRLFMEPIGARRKRPGDATTPVPSRCTQCDHLYQEFLAANRWCKRLPPESPLYVTAFHWRRSRLLDLEAHSGRCAHSRFICACGREFYDARALHAHQHNGRGPCPIHVAMVRLDCLPLQTFA